MFRERRQERREERREERRGDDMVQFKMRQKIVAVGDDFWIEDSSGQRAYKVDGKALRARDTLLLEDANGTELFKIQARVVRVRDTMEIEDAGGRKVATVKKAMITPLRERWSVDVEGGAGFDVQGNVVDSLGEPRYRYAVIVAGGEDGPKGLRFANNLFAPGRDGVANVELP